MSGKIDPLAYAIVLVAGTLGLALLLVMVSVALRDWMDRRGR